MRWSCSTGLADPRRCIRSAPTNWAATCCCGCVRAARSLGAGVPHILWTHILPNVLAPLVVATTLSVGDVILLESVLSFLGLGILPPLASWGTMLSNAQEMITTAPLLAIYPGVMIFLTVIACNLLGDALQRHFDPRAAVRG